MKRLARKRLSARLRALRDSTALMLEEAARMKAAVRKEFEEGVTWMEETLAASRRIAWLSLAPGRGLDGGGPRYLSVRETDSKVIPEIPATEGTTPLFFFRHRLLPARSKHLLRRGLA